MEDLKNQDAAEMQQETPTEQDVDTKPTTSEEKADKTYTQAQVDEIKKNAIMEGMRKANKNANNDMQSQLDEKQTALDEKDALINQMQEQINAYKNIDIMNSLGVDSKNHTDLLAIIRGNGEEINEETISKYAEKHPEWQVAKNTKGVEEMGQYAEKQEDAKAKEKEEKELNKLFRII